MSRYADVDALMQSIRRRLGIASLDNLLESEKSIVKEIDSAPIIDLVRCGECLHWRNGDGACGVCRRTSLFPMTKADDFCSYGELKESE